MLNINPTWAHGHKKGDITIHHPYSAPTPPGANVAAGYFVVTNESDEDDRLLGGHALFAQRLELHKTVIDNDVARMRQLKNGVLLPKGSKVMLMPGATHLMFVGLEHQLILGERYQVTLVFEKSGEKVVEFVVQEIASQEAMDHSKM